MKILKQNLLVLSVVVTLLMPLAIMPLSSPVLSNVVVRMSDDASTNQAIKILNENSPNLVVVDYGSLEYSLIIHRVAGAVIWVSHGSDQGILADDTVISWESFSQSIRRTPAKDVVLACQSSELDSYLSPNEALLFDGVVESTLGALITSFVLNGAFVMQMLVDTLASLVSGVIKAQFLVLTNLEIAWNAVNFMIGLMFAGAGFGITTIVVDIVVGIAILLLIDIALILGGIYGGYYSALDLVLPLISFMSIIILALTMAFPAFTPLIAASAAILTSPYGWFLVSVNIGIFIAQMYVDYLD